MKRKKQILFVHQNFPGQYRYLSRYYAQHNEWDAIAVGERQCIERQLRVIPKNITLLAYDMPKRSPENISSRLKSFSSYVDRADVLEQLLLRQKHQGLAPDVILAHPGWGEAMYLKEIFPNAKLICFFEYYFSTTDNNIGFDPDIGSSLNQQISYRMANTTSLISLGAADVGVCPTHWQLSTFPKEYQQNIDVIHDGVDTVNVKPQPCRELTLTDLSGRAVTLSDNDEVVSYSVRNLEPSRGFHRFMRALPSLQKTRPNAYFVVIGGDDKSYSGTHPSGKCWREILLDEVQDKLDMQRIIFAGKIPYASLLTVFSITRLHIYLTTPFVLSWSLLEAMACEAPILASATPPVEEVVNDGENGILFDYFSIEDMVEKANVLLDDADKRSHIGKQARRHIIKHYDLQTICLPQHVKMIET